jgi:hypothetical protein
MNGRDNHRAEPQHFKRVRGSGVSPHRVHLARTWPLVKPVGIVHVLILTPWHHYCT